MYDVTLLYDDGTTTAVTEPYIAEYIHDTYEGWPHARNLAAAKGESAGNTADWPRVVGVGVSLTWSVSALKANDPQGYEGVTEVFPRLDTLILNRGAATQLFKGKIVGASMWGDEITLMAESA